MLWGLLMQNKVKSGAATDAIFLAFVQIMTYLCSMILAKLLSMGLTKIEYGTYSSVTLVTTTAYSLIMLGLPDCINYFYNIFHDKADVSSRKSYVNTIFFISLVVGIVTSFLLAFCSKFIADYFGNTAVQVLIVITCFLPCLENSARLFQTLYVSTGKAKVISISNMLLSISRIIIVSIAIFLFHDLMLVFILNGLTEIAQLIILWLMFKKYSFAVNPFSYDKSKITKILKYGLPMGVYAIVSSLMRNIDKFVIGRLESTETLAVYSNCSKLLPLSIIAASFATILIPFITKYVSANNKTKIKELFSIYLEIGYLTIWMFSVAILISAKEVIPFLYSDEYIEGLPIFVIYVIDGILQFASMHLIVSASGNTRYIMKLSGVMLVLNFVLDIVLYYLLNLFGFGVLGPAIATCISTLLYAMILFKKSCKVAGLKTIDVVDFKNVAIYIFELLIVSIVVYFIRIGLLLVGCNKYLCMVICCIVFCAIIILLNLKRYKYLFISLNKYKIGENSAN